MGVERWKNLNPPDRRDGLVVGRSLARSNRRLTGGEVGKPYAAAAGMGPLRDDGGRGSRNPG